MKSTLSNECLKSCDEVGYAGTVLATEKQCGCKS